MKRTTQFLFVIIIFLSTLSLSTAQSLLYDNGPFFNSTGTGLGGANESVLYTTTFGMTTIGFGHQAALANRVADDFIITDCRWRIDSIVFFSYQTGSTTTSTFTGVNFRIWNSMPNELTPVNVIYGDTTTNAMIRSVWSGAYRITETTSGNSTRPIMRNTCVVNSLFLTSGTYWIDWASLGSLASGPWAPARTPVGIAITGNGLQRLGGGMFNNAVDGGTGTPQQGFPFLIYGSVYNPTADAGLDITNCTGQSVNLGGSPSATGIAPLSYAWSPNTGLSDSTLANPSLTLTDTTNYTLMVTDSLGCIVMDTIVAIGTPLPQAMITPVGSTSICPGDSVTLNAFTSLGYEYLWSNSDTNSSTTVYNNINYMLDITDSLGCMNSDTISINWYPLPIASISPSGTSNICSGSDILLTGNSGTGYNYLWSTTETTQNISVSAAGIVVLNITDSVGCTASDSITIVVDPAPNTAITQVGASLTSDQAGASYQWIDCGNGNSIIGGATSQNYIATANGNYAVIVNLGGCIDTSACNLVFGFGIDPSEELSARIFPNPAQEIFYVEINENINNDYLVEIQNTIGQVIQSQKMNPSNNQKISVDCSTWIPGIYMVHVIDPVTHKEFKHRVIIQ